MKIIAVKLDLNLPEPGRLLSTLDTDIQAKIQRFRKSEDQLRAICGDLLIRTGAFEQWQLPAGRLKRTVNRYGKPAFSDYPSLHYNLSHSGHWVIAVFDTSPVGIDIEEVAGMEPGIADHFFAPAETKWLASLHPKQKTRAFYELWTLKESFIKADGKGLSIPLDSFRFEFDEGGTIYFHPPSDVQKQWHFKQYEIDPTYALAVCASHACFPEQVETLQWDHLLSRFHFALHASN